MQSLPPDADRNRPLDRDVLFAAQSLVIAHATLITLFPDIQGLSEELDRYRQQSEAIDALRDRILDPVLDQLAAGSRIFDEETLQITRQIKQLNDQESAVVASSPPTLAATATKHSWLRGSLAAIGQFFLDHTKELIKQTRDALAKHAAGIIITGSLTLAGAISTFLVNASQYLLELSQKLQATFGWIESLLSSLGILG